MDVHLEPAEVLQLERLLTSQLGDLRMQIADTDTSTFREKLREEKAGVLNLLAKLGVDTSVMA